MKNIFKIFSSDNLKKNIKEIFNRFPVTIIIIFIMSGLFFTELHYHDQISDFYNKRIFIAIFALIMTFIFSIGTYLSTENSDKNRFKRNLFQIIPIGFGITFYNIFSLNPNDFENFLFFGLSFSGIIAFLFFAPYLKNLFNKGIKQSIFYTYFYNISVVLLISFVFAGILFGLGAIGITATDALFDLNINGEKTYGNWAILSLSIIAPLFALNKIPNNKSFTENHFNENAFFSFLIKFVAIPFIYLYFFILYAYSIKVLSNFEQWPKGEISWLVIGFSIFGYLTYSFSYIFEEKNKLIKNFRKIFPYAVIPQIFMLFYAIYLRINQYDITVNRYFVIIFGLWLLFTSLHFIFSKKKNLIAIPAGLTLFIIIISIIPKYNVYTLPEDRQLTRLENNLIEAGIINIQDEMYKYTISKEIIPLKNYSDISQELSKNIHSGIYYLCDFNNCSNIKELFPKIYAEILEKDKKEWGKSIIEKMKLLEKNNKLTTCEEIRIQNEKGFTINEIGNVKEGCYDKERINELKNEEYNELNKWEIVNQITEIIKVKNYFSKNETNRKYFIYYKNYKQNFFPINTDGYSKIYNLNSESYNADKGEILIKNNGNEIIKISIKEISNKLIKNFGTGINRDLNKGDLSFELEGGKYKLFFEKIGVLNPNYIENKDGMNYGGYISGYLLIK